MRAMSRALPSLRKNLGTIIEKTIMITVTRQVAKSARRITVVLYRGRNMLSKRPMGKQMRL